MASRLAPRVPLEAPREATGEEFALLEDDGRYKEAGGASHEVDLKRGCLRYFVRMTDQKTRKKNRVRGRRQTFTVE